MMGMPMASFDPNFAVEQLNFGKSVSKTFRTLLRNCCWNADPWVWLLLTTMCHERKSRCTLVEILHAKPSNAASRDKVSLPHAFLRVAHHRIA